MALEIAGMNVDNLVSEWSPMILLIILGVIGFLLIGAVIFAVYWAIKRNWIIPPTAWKFKFIIWRPSGETVMPIFDTGALIQDKGEKKIRLKKLGFNIAIPKRKFFYPNNLTEGFSAGHGHYTPIIRTFVGYKGALSPEILAQLDDVQTEEEKTEILKQHQLEIQNMEASYIPEIDTNALNMQASENDKTARELKSPSENAMYLGLAIVGILMLLSLALVAQGQMARAEADKAIGSGLNAVAAGQNRIADLINESQQTTRPKPVTGGG